MFRPTLKRPKNTYTSTLDTRNQSNQFLRPHNQDHPIKAIPDFFFQDSKSKFLNINSRSNKQTGVLNTMQFHYPKQVQQEISDANGCGQILLASDIFCFYKNETAYFWRYSNDDYLVPKKYLKHVFEYPISSLSLKEIDISQGFNKPTIMMAVACGYKIKLFTLNNFELEKYQGIPDVEYMKIQIQGFQAISKLDIVIQPYGDNGNFNVLIVYGNTSGKVSIFDYTNKKKIVNDDWKTYLERVVTSSSRTETFYKQIIHHQGFFYCLCQKVYKMNSFSKKLKRLFRSPEGHIQSEQFLQIYKIQFIEQRKGDSNETKSVLSRFTLHEQISERNLHNKIVNCFGNCFREKRQIGEPLQAQIQSMSKSDYVTILFKNGDSIQIDQNISFADTVVSPPLIHSQFQMHQQVSKIENNSRDILRVGYGDQIQLFDDYMIAGQNQKTIYCIEFNSNNLKFPFRTNSFWKYDIDKYERRSQPNSRYILFAGSSMYLVQKITKPQVLLLFSLSMSNSNLYYSQKIPSEKLFKEKIADFIKLWGEIQVAYQAIQALMIVKNCQNKKIYIREDIVARIHRQLIQEQEWNSRSKENEDHLLQREYYKNIYFVLEKSVEEYLWKIFFMLKNHQIQIEQVIPGEKGYNVDISSLIFQMLLSEVLSETTSWNNKFFCLQRKRVYNMISYTEIAGSIIADFMNYDEQLLRTNQSKFEELSKKNKSIRDMITVPVQGKVQASQHQFYEMVSLIFDKIVLLMKIYDFISESDEKNKQFFTFHQMLRGGNDSQRLQFSLKIISILEMNNDILLNELDDKFPQLQISLVRKFIFWKKVHCENVEKKSQNADHDVTSDEIDIDEIGGLDSMMTPFFYESCFKKHFLQQNQISKLEDPKNQKQKSQSLAKVGSLILAIIRKINELKRREISLNNYKNQKMAMANYFSKITIIGIDQEYNHTQYCLQFFSEQCQKIFSHVLEWNSKQKINKQDVQVILEKIKKEIPIEVRCKIAANLQKHGIKELKNVIYEREIMVNIGRESGKVVSNSSVQRKQLVQGSMRVV